MDRQQPPFDLTRRNLVLRRRTKRFQSQRRRTGSSDSIAAIGWRVSFLGI